MKSLLQGELSDRSISELVDLFEQLSLAEADGMVGVETARINRYIKRRFKVLNELRHRATDERPALFSLYDHKHPWVRLNVASGTYALNPQRAEAVMREVAATKMQPWAGDAGMSLWFLAEGKSQLPYDPELKGAR
jgi:hypothetical protein